ncbi:MAG: succinate dehydrogenase, cytochrome b556 subunit [Hyphomicrobiaceae bacterium]
MANAETQRTKPRPLSPHLQIYSPLINMVMSILHRMTGAALYVGTLLLVWWLIAAATGPDYFAYVSGIMGSALGLTVLFGFSWALLHHMIGGIRHLIWDTGRGFDLATVNTLSWGTIILSLGLTVLLWIWALAAKGGA